jgi:LAO/AO transport system kinase
MEMADAIVINKADGDNIRKAKLAKVNSTEHTSFPAKKSGWTPQPLQLLIKRHPQVWETIEFWNLPKQ